MNDIGKEYGAALFMLASEENARDEYAASLEKIKSIFKESPEYLSFLASPGISLGERLSAIETAFADHLPTNVLSFVQLMCEKGRIDNFFEAAEEYKSLLDASKHISCAKVTSAVELEEDEKNKLIDKLKAISGGDVVVEYKVDNTIMGGLIVELDDKIMDGSLRNRLREVKDVMNS
ncbi:MAG: ATP synthase F1 subunit delta [Clostridia bacterium]|nr:ATP synthase F1 subunit delta [Clostridia bacterium]